MCIMYCTIMRIKSWLGCVSMTLQGKFLVCRVLGELLPPVLSCFRPDIVLYDAGVDPHKDDSLGKLALSDEGLLRRELQVLDTCLAADIPVAGYVGGGYSPDLDVLAQRHCCLHRAASEMWGTYELGN